MAYKLQFPARSHIHPVVHVSQLKKALPSTTTVNPDTPLLWVIVGRPLYLVKLLDIHLHRHSLSTTTMGMVQWSNLPQDLTTLENLQVLQHQFPLALTCGQAVILHGGCHKLC